MKLFFTSILLFLIPTGSLEPDSILGIWLTAEKDAKIEIYKKEGVYHGRIIWVEEALDAEGKPKLDRKNPDQKLRKRPIIGIDLVSGFKFSRGKWEGGEVYDPKNGKTYDSHMKLKKNKLEVRGYIGISMFGRTVTWSRVE